MKMKNNNNNNNKIHEMNKQILEISSRASKNVYTKNGENEKKNCEKKTTARTFKIMTKQQKWTILLSKRKV